jgi:hypothetical protein
LFAEGEFESPWGYFGRLKVAQNRAGEQRNSRAVENGNGQQKTMVRGCRIIRSPAVYCSSVLLLKKRVAVGFVVFDCGF